MEKELISGSIVIISGLALIFLFLKKIPLLVSLPEEKVESLTGRLVKRTKEKIREVRIFHRSFWEFLLEKNLRKIRIFTLKIDNKIFHWLVKKKEKEIEKEKKEGDFWDKIQKEVK